MPQCLVQSDKDVVWPFCPSVVPAALFAFLFGVLTLTHLTQAAIHRKAYCWVIVVAGLWQTAAYSLREYSVYNQKNSSIYSIWFVMILIGPLWINAFVYMVVARMVWVFLPERKLGGIKAWRFGTIFVLLDIVAFLVQGADASMASGDDIPQSQVMNGLHIYMGGVGIQQLFILIFAFLLTRFQKHYNLAHPSPATPATPLPRRLIYVLYSALGFITVRIIYRLVEYSSGTSSAIPTHEAYMYVFETVPMFFAVLALNVVHPGKVMPGKENNIPGKKMRKQMAAEGTLFGKMGKYETVVRVGSSNTELGVVAGGYPERTYVPQFGTVQGYEEDRRAGF